MIQRLVRGVACVVLLAVTSTRGIARAEDESLPVAVRDAIQESLDAYTLGRSALETAGELKGAEREGALARARRAFEKSLQATNLVLREVPRAGLSPEGSAKAIGDAEYNAACLLALLGKPQEGQAALLRAVAVGWWDMNRLAGDPDIEGFWEVAGFEDALNAARTKYQAAWDQLHPAVLLWREVYRFEKSRSEEWAVLGGILGRFDALDGAPTDATEQEARVAGATVKALMAARGRGMPLDAVKAQALLEAALARGGASRRAANAATVVRILGVEDVTAVELAATVLREFPEALPADERDGFKVLSRARGREAAELVADTWVGVESRIRLAALKGKTVVFAVDSGSSTRAALASVQSLRHLAELRRRYADRGVAVFALVFGAPKDDVASFLRELGVQVPAGVLTQADQENWVPTGGYPAFWVVRKDGVVHGHVFGFPSGWLSLREQLLDSALASPR